MTNPVVALTASDKLSAGIYEEAVARAGGDFLLLTPQEPVADDVLGRVGALVLSGGEDVSPERYGSDSEADGVSSASIARDEMEIALVRAALEVDLPIYGVGRGMQILNVAMGGKIALNIPGHIDYESDEEKAAFHQIYISPGSKLAAVVGSGGFVRVNSWHRHGIKEAHKSPLLLASAYSLEDGYIEALESPRHRWVIAVQFHPERRMELPPHFDRLMQSLVERAKERITASNLL